MKCGGVVTTSNHETGKPPAPDFARPAPRSVGPFFWAYRPAALCQAMLEGTATHQPRANDASGFQAGDCGRGHIRRTDGPFCLGRRLTQFTRARSCWSSSGHHASLQAHPSRTDQHCPDVPDRGPVCRPRKFETYQPRPHNQWTPGLSAFEKLLSRRSSASNSTERMMCGLEPSLTSRKKWTTKITDIIVPLVKGGLFERPIAPNIVLFRNDAGFPPRAWHR